MVPNIILPPTVANHSNNYDINSDCWSINSDSGYIVTNNNNKYYSTMSCDTMSIDSYMSDSNKDPIYINASDIRKY